MNHDTFEIQAGARLTINLDAVVGNWRSLADRIAPAVAGAVVKADAYGLGAARVAAALQAAGCREFFVAHLAEAIELVPVVDTDTRLYVLNGLQPGAERACADAGVTPVLNSLEQAYRWRDLARAFGRPLPAALQLDSGMSRLGLQPGDVEVLADDPSFFGHVPLTLLMTHLACADESASAANPEQLAAFEALAARLPPTRRSIANSGGVFLDHGFHGDVARPGLSLYGAVASDAAAPMAPVVRLDARVIQLRDIPAGQGVGYGLTDRQDQPRRIATLSVGYADGWPRQLSNRGAAFFQGVRLPIAGRVSMDSITLDVSDLASHGVTLRPGDFVELIGPNQTLEDVAAQADTIAYEILTRLGRRYSRTYLEKTPVVTTAQAPFEVTAP